MSCICWTQATSVSSLWSFVVKESFFLEIPSLCGKISSSAYSTTGDLLEFRRSSPGQPMVMTRKNNIYLRGKTKRPLASIFFNANSALLIPENHASSQGEFQKCFFFIHYSKKKSAGVFTSIPSSASCQHTQKTKT